MARRFNPPPNWPLPPTGWTPPKGWRPDPSWPPPPAGWQLWSDDSDRATRLLKRVYLGPVAHDPVRKAVRGTLLGILTVVVAIGLLPGGQTPEPTALAQPVPTATPTATATPTTAPPSTTVTLPDLTGLPEEDAQLQLKTVGLTSTLTDVNELSCYDACVVSSMSPKSGTSVTPGSTVDLVRISREAYGFYSKHAKMPKLTGLSETKASDTLDAVSALVDTDYVTAKDGQKADQVIKQSPKAGVALKPGQAVHLTVTQQGYSIDEEESEEDTTVSGTVHPGAFCSTEGATGYTTAGTLMRCSTTASDSRARWRRA
ncbi:PASTA domain-containing protein [Nonomuraea sp. NPDC050556]|uniref:PASTA domain-containing protein n=1 Tax=Nonomuraea sp. NPDC050556 TaxID=3364369 RepID=UPI0037999274